MVAIPPIPCANTSSCAKEGRCFCGRCRLVKYCSADCQKAHYPTHKSECKSPLVQDSWRPGWEVQNRTPAFLHDGPGPDTVSHGAKKYLCGNVPSFDHLAYAGLGSLEEVDLLFGASGDLRNLIATVNGCRADSKIRAVVNDQEPYVAVRNLLVLLVLGGISDAAEAAETAIHLWYSPMLPGKLMQRVRELCEEKLDKMRPSASKMADGDTLVSTTIKLRNEVMVRCALPRYAWTLLFMMLNARISATQATQSRGKAMLSPGRVDFRDRYLQEIAACSRVSVSRYWLDGMVLPFAADRKMFDQPNFTMFDHITGEWLQMDNANPLQAWPLEDVRATAADVAPKNDLYGALHMHLHKVLQAFHSRLHTSSHPISFSVLGSSAEDLARELPKLATAPQTFDLIEVSNITDAGYLGISGTLSCIAAPLLKPHGIMVSLFMNYVAENDMASRGPGSNEAQDDLQATVLRMFRFFRQCRPIPSIMLDVDVSQMHKHLSLAYHFRDAVGHWERYSKALSVEKTAKENGMKLVRVDRPFFVGLVGKDGNKVLDKVKELTLGGLNGQETYVLWGKTAG